MTGKWQTEGTFDTALEKLGASRHALVHWDFSGDPVDNSDRKKKLGKADKTMGIAIASYNEDTRNAKFVTGLDKDGVLLTSYRFHEPDAMVLRVHDDKGNGQDTVWAPRLIVDHDNYDYQRKHKSTMLINQCPQQDWAWVRDLFWIIKLGASCSHKELAFDPAGYLKMARTKTVTGSITRAALALSIEKRGGHITDGRYAAQLWHLITGKPKNLGTQTQGGCADVGEANAALRGDVNFLLGQTLGHLAFYPAMETDGYQWSGMHFLHTPAPLPPAFEPQSDPKSNQKTITRNLEKGIWVWVKVLPYAIPTGGVPPRIEFQLPPGAISVTKSLPSGAGGNGGGFTYWNFLAGYAMDDMFELGIPELGSPVDLRVFVQYKLSQLVAGAETIKLYLVYKVVPANGAVPASPSYVGPYTLTISDNPASVNDVKTLTMEVKNIFGGKAHGGKVICEFVRDGTTDTFPGRFMQVDEAIVHYKPRPMEGVA